MTSRRVRLERVGGVVVAVAEEDADRPVDEAVGHELGERIALDVAPVREPCAEGAVIAGLEHVVVADQIVGRIGCVGHHDGHGVAAVVREAVADGVPEARREG